MLYCIILYYFEVYYTLFLGYIQTFCLSEALEFAVGCVQSLQSRIAIKLEPINSKICQYCITDKQVRIFYTIYIVFAIVIRILLTYTSHFYYIFSVYYFYLLINRYPH